MKALYPVIFTQTDACVLVEVPDYGIMTEGEDMVDAVEMARDAIGLAGISMQDHGDALPPASELSRINKDGGTFAADGESIVSLVDVDFNTYRRKNDMKTVRRNVTLPNWLNAAAEEAQINVSKVLQEALTLKLKQEGYTRSNYL